MRDPEGSLLLDQYALASRLGITLSAVLDMSCAEYNGWLQFFAIVNPNRTT